ncbi:MAG: hypothetical protein AAF928_10765 [Myxococcota bacterium]
MKALLRSVARGVGIVAALGLVACQTGGSGAAVGPKTSSRDVYVPADVARSEVVLRVSLPPAADCEERFDLELYRERGVDLIDWDARSGCSGRGVDITYFPERLPEPRLLERVRELATDVAPAPRPDVAPEAKKP